MLVIQKDHSRIAEEFNTYFTSVGRFNSGQSKRTSRRKWNFQ